MYKIPLPDDFLNNYGYLLNERFYAGMPRWALVSAAPVITGKIRKGITHPSVSDAIAYIHHTEAGPVAYMIHDSFMSPYLDQFFSSHPLARGSVLLYDLDESVAYMLDEHDGSTTFVNGRYVTVFIRENKVAIIDRQAQKPMAYCRLPSSVLGSAIKCPTNYIAARIAGDSLAAVSYTDPLLVGLRGRKFQSIQLYDLGDFSLRSFYRASRDPTILFRMGYDNSCECEDHQADRVVIMPIVHALTLCSINYYYDRYLKRGYMCGSMFYEYPKIGVEFSVWFGEDVYRAEFNAVHDLLITRYTRMLIDIPRPWNLVAGACFSMVTPTALYATDSLFELLRVIGDRELSRDLGIPVQFISAPFRSGNPTIRRLLRLVAEVCPEVKCQELPVVEPPTDSPQIMLDPHNIIELPALR